MNRLKGTGSLLRLIFRRDRLRLPLWIAAIAAFSAGYVPVFEGFLLGQTDASFLASMMENPAMIALAGPVYGRADYHLGAAYGNMLLVFCAMFAAVMNIFFVARHTRREEETGRAELLMAQPLGRAARPAAVLLSACIVNTVLALLTAGLLQLLAEHGMTPEGNLLFGAAIGVTGLFFAALTALLAQIPENTRTLTSSALLLMLGMYLVRGAGDLYSETLARISPLGLILRVQVFVQNEWWPVALVLGLAVLLMVPAAVLSSRRDMGRGLFESRPGRRSAQALLSSPGGLALRLLRNSFFVWSLVIFSVAAMYAALFGEMEDFITSNELMRSIFAQDPDLGVLEQFLGLLNALMAVLTTIPVLAAVQRPVAEELRGRADPVLGRAVSRTRWLLSWVLPALCFSVLLQTLVAAGFWGIGSRVTEDLPPLTTFLISAYSYLPAIWLMTGFGVFLAGAVPKLRMVSYLYLGGSFVLIYLGSMVNLADWTEKLTPFGYVSNYPVEILELAPLLFMNGLALVLIAAGILFFGRRDLLQT